MTIKQEGNWGVYVRHIGEEDDAMSMFVRLDTNFLGERAEGEPRFIARITMPFENPDWVSDDGLPTREASEELFDIEEGLMDALSNAGAHGQILAIVTVPGLRDFIFTSDDPADFMAKAQGVVDGAPVRLDLASHEDGAFYDNFIAPDEFEWNQIKNQRVVQNLLENGSDPNKDHPIDHFFKIEDASKVAALRAELEEAGFTHADTDDEYLRMVMPRPLTQLMDINEDTEIAILLARKYDQEYNGWGSPIVK